MDSSDLLDESDKESSQEEPPGRSCVIAVQHSSAEKEELGEEADLSEDPLEDGLADPWNLVRIAMGSLAGEGWRLKQALVWPTEAFKLRPLDDDSCKSERAALWDSFQKTQTFDSFKTALPFRPNSTNNMIEFVVVGEVNKLEQRVHIQALLQHLEAFIGFPVKLRDEAIPLGPQFHPRQNAERQEQFGAHYVLAQLRSSADPRSVCTIGLTIADLYPPNTYEFVTGITDASQRVAVYSLARYFCLGTRDTVQSPQDDERSDVAKKRERMTQCMIKTLCREALKLCSMAECHLVECLMNPFPGGPPEAIRKLPLSLCCICLRKLQFLTQADLLDRYAGLPPVLGDRFLEETVWIWERMVQVGMPTYACLRYKSPLGSAIA